MLHGLQASPDAPGRRVVFAAAVALAAASTTTAVPSLKALVAAHGLGEGAGALFVVAHVVGQVIGALLLGRWLGGGRVIDARRLVVAGLTVSAALSLLMVVTPGFEALVALRLADGLAHVAAIMGLLGTGGGEGPAREGRLRVLGGVLVVGVAGGLGTGALLTGASIDAPFAVAAGFAATAALLAALVVPRQLRREVRPTGPSAAPRATVLAVAAERFCFGVITVALPFAAASSGHARLIGGVIGTMMVCSVLTLPLVAAAARRTSWARVGLVSAVVLTAAMAALVAPTVTTTAVGFGWAVLAGVAAAGIYATALAAIAAIDDAAARTRAVGVVHAAGSAGHATGALLTGVATSAHGLAMAPTSAAALLGAIAVATAGVVLARAAR